MRCFCGLALCRLGRFFLLRRGGGDFKPVFSFLLGDEFTVVLEDDVWRVARLQRSFSNIAGLRNTMGNKSMAEAVFRQREPSLDGEPAQVVEPVGARTDGSLAFFFRHEAQPRVFRSVRLGEFSLGFFPRCKWLFSAAQRQSETTRMRAVLREPDLE